MILLFFSFIEQHQGFDSFCQSRFSSSESLQWQYAGAKAAEAAAVASQLTVQQDFNNHYNNKYQTQTHSHQQSQIKQQSFGLRNSFYENVVPS